MMAKSRSNSSGAYMSPNATSPKPVVYGVPSVSVAELQTPPVPGPDRVLKPSAFREWVWWLTNTRPQFEPEGEEDFGR